MTARDSEEQKTETRDEQDTDERSREDPADDVQLSEEGREEVHQMVEAYEDKPTVALPGTDHTITGTAINDWLDEEGNPKFGDPDEHPFAAADDEPETDESKETSADG